jgi:ABC-2 type transport system ATP-binding protein
VEDYLLIDAVDRPALLAELSALNVPFSESPLVRVDVSGSQVQTLLKKLQTPLSVVRTHTPSLEDAYLEIIRRGEDV